jgi:hypothetical protein
MSIGSLLVHTYPGSSLRAQWAFTLSTLPLIRVGLLRYPQKQGEPYFCTISSCSSKVIFPKASFNLLLILSSTGCHRRDYPCLWAYARLDVPSPINTSCLQTKKHLSRRLYPFFADYNLSFLPPLSFGTSRPAFFNSSSLNSPSSKAWSIV